MKLALILLSVCVVISHQQYFRDPRLMFGLPWMWMPVHQQPAFFNDHGAPNEANLYEGQLVSGDGHNNILNEEEEGFTDTQSRVKGFSRYKPRPFSNNDQQKARFFFNLLASTTGAYSNPLLKTATFTSMQVLTLLTVVRCVPQSQVIAGAPACRRKREDTLSQDENDDNQFMIVPSKTLKLTPTALVSNDRSSEQLWSSKDDIISGKMLSTDYNPREKRFFFVNKNQFVVSSTITTFSFVNVTSTATATLLNPVPPAGVAACVPAAALFCVRCLPPGFVICAAPAG